MTKRLLDADITARADTYMPVWSASSGTHVYVPQPSGGTGTFHGVSAYRTTNLSIPSTTDTAVPMDSEFFDTDAFHSTSANTDRFTVPTGLGGYYFITATIRFSFTASGQQGDCIVRLNGTTTTLIGMQTTAGGGGDSCVAATTVAHLNAGDYINLVAWTSSAISTLSNQPNAMLVGMTMYKVG